MIYFIDQTSEKQHHMMFNVSMLQILKNVYPNQKIVYQGILSNQDVVLLKLSNEERELISLEAISYSKSKSNSFFAKLYNYIKKEHLRFNSLKTILKKSTKEDVILFSITTFTTFLFFKLLKRKYPVTVLMVLHGDLDFVYNASSSIEKTMGFVYKIIFKIKAPNFYYLILNKIAKPFLIHDDYLKQSEILEINHPYPFSKEEVHTKINKIKRPLVFGHIGSAEVKRKNSHYIYQVAGNCRKEIEKEQMRFKLIGLSDLDMKPYQSNFVEKVIGNLSLNQPQYLTRELYEESIVSLQYAFFFYDKNQYIFRASGAVIDAVFFEIPIIALKHPYFEYLFKEAGNIGHLFDSVEEITQFILQINVDSVNYQEEYQKQKINLQKLKQKFKVDYIAKDLANQINFNR
jgi:hypothetical protein